MELENASLIKSTNEIELICYLPDGLKYFQLGVRGINQQTDGTTQEITFDENNYKYEFLNSSNIIEWNDKLSEEAKKNINLGYTAIILTINVENQNDFQLLQNNKIQIFCQCSKFNSYNEECRYNGQIEILTYKNTYGRRLQYESASAVAGNHLVTNLEDKEKDYAKSNDAIIIPPTGKNQSFTNIKIMILIITISAIILKNKIKK